MSYEFKKRSFHKNKNNGYESTRNNSRNEMKRYNGKFPCQNSSASYKRKKNYNWNADASDMAYDSSSKPNYSLDNKSSKFYERPQKNFYKEDKTNHTKNGKRHSKGSYEKNQIHGRKRSHSPEQQNTKRKVALKPKNVVSYNIEPNYVDTYEHKKNNSTYFDQESRNLVNPDHKKIKKNNSIKNQSSERESSKKLNKIFADVENFSNHSGTDKDRCDKPISKLLEQSDSDEDIKKNKKKQHGKSKNRSRSSSKDKEIRTKQKKSHKKKAEKKKKSKTSSKECNGNEIDLQNNQVCEMKSEKVTVEIMDDSKWNNIKSLCFCESDGKCVRKKVCPSLISQFRESLNSKEQYAVDKKEGDAQLSRSKEQCKVLQEQLTEQAAKHKKEIEKTKAESEEKIQQLQKVNTSLEEMVQKKENSLVASEVSNENLLQSIRELNSIIEEKSLKEQLLCKQIESENTKHNLELQQADARMVKLKEYKGRLNMIKSMILGTESIFNEFNEHHPEVLENKTFEPKVVKKVEHSKKVLEIFNHVREVKILNDIYVKEIIYGKSLETLFSNKCLQDQVINRYSNMIEKRSLENKNLPQVAVMNTYFFNKLVKVGFKAVQRWTRKVNIFEKDMLFVPIHNELQEHWTLVVADLNKHTISFFDSLGEENNLALEEIKKYLAEEHMDKLKVKLEVSDWTLKNLKTESPQQYKSLDCGVFVCQTIEFLSRNQPLDFSQDDMDMLRQRMLLEIVFSHIVTCVCDINKMSCKCKSQVVCVPPPLVESEQE